MAKRCNGRTGRPARKVERKMSLSAEADRRLGVHAVLTGRRPSAVIEDLILTHLRRWVVQDRGENPADGRGGESGAAA